MTESQAVTKLISNLKQHGFFWKSADRFTSGIPDIIGCYLGRFVGIEMKVDNGKPTALQLYNIKQIQKNTGYTALITYKNKDKTWYIGTFQTPHMHDLIAYLLDRMRHHDEN